MSRAKLHLVFVMGLRNVWRNPRRSALTLLAMTVGVCSAIGLAALARGMSEQMIADSVYHLTGHIQIHDERYLDDPVVGNSMPRPNAELQAVLADAAVSAWSTRIRVPAVVMSERESLGVSLVGIDPSREQQLSFIAESVKEGRYLADANDRGIIIGQKLLDRLETDLGKRVVVMSEHSEGSVADKGFRIVGVFDAELESTELAYAFAGEKVVQKMLKLDTEVSEVALVLDDRNKIDSFVDRLQAAGGSLNVASWMDLEPLVVAIVTVQDGVLQIWYFIVVIAIAFGLVNTLFMAIFERTREIGLMQALGMRPNMVMLQILFESFVLLLLGIAIGNALAFFGVWCLRNGIDLSQFAEATEVVQISSRITPIIKTGDCIAANLTLVLLGLLSSFYPAWRASQDAPVVAIARH